MRCLTLAEALKRLGCTCIFISRKLPGNLNAHVTNKGFEVFELENLADDEIAPLDRGPGDGISLQDWERDAAATSQAVQATGTTWVIVDHYGLDARWEGKLGQTGIRVMAIDDLGNRPHACNIVVAPGIGFDEAAIQTIQAGAKNALIGAHYIFIRSEFSSPSLQRRRNGSVRRILVYMGSHDVMNQTGKALSALQRFSGIEVKAIIGPHHPSEAELMAFQSANVQVMVYAPQIWTVMAWADLALGTCGQAAWERCVVGLPTIAVINAENQRMETIALHREGAVINIGDSREVKAEHWYLSVKSLVNDPSSLLDMSARAKSLMKDWEESIPKITGLLLA